MPHGKLMSQISLKLTLRPSPACRHVSALDVVVVVIRDVHGSPNCCDISCLVSDRARNSEVNFLIDQL